MVMVGMSHSGDENGSSQYACAAISFPQIPTCGVTFVTGKWVPHVYANADTNTISYEEGITRSDEYAESRTSSWEASVTASVTSGFAFGEVEVEVGFKYGEDLTETVTSALSQTSIVTNTLEFGPGRIWQFVLDITDECATDGWQMKTRDLVLTESNTHPPCCLPGFAEDPLKQHGPCNNSSPCQCDAAICSLSDAPDRKTPTEAPTPLDRAPVSAPSPTSSGPSSFQTVPTFFGMILIVLVSSSSLEVFLY